MLRFVAINTGTTVALWLCLEVFFGLFMGTRVSVHSRIQFATMTSRGFIAADGKRGFRLRPDYADSTVHTNAQGFRGNELPTDLDEKRLILALGESTTFGWGVADDETYPSHLEKILNSPSDQGFVVVNAGVPSYSSQQVLLYAKELLDRFHPDVVLVCLLWNDLFYSSLEDWTPQSLVPEYPSPMQQALFGYSRVYRWLNSRPDGPELVNFYSNDALEQYRANIASIVRLCRSKDVAVVFVEPPFSEALVPKAGVNIWKNRFSKKFTPKLADLFLAAQIEATESEDVPLIRHDLGISERPQADLFLDFLHTDGKGNQIIAQAVATFLQESPLLAIPKLSSDRSDE